MKSRIVAAILAFLFGGLGVHKFYMGKIGSGVLYLLFCWTGIPALIAFIECIIYLTCSSDKEFSARYCGIVINDQNANTSSSSVPSSNNDNIL